MIPDIKFLRNLTWNFFMMSLNSFDFIIFFAPQVKKQNKTKKTPRKNGEGKMSVASIYKTIPVFEVRLQFICCLFHSFIYIPRCHHLQIQVVEMGFLQRLSGLQTQGEEFSQVRRAQHRATTPPHGNEPFWASGKDASYVRCFWGCPSR